MKKFADYIPEAEALLAEKAVSQQQQKFMGMVHALQKGKKIKGASPELKKVARTMKKSDAKDFAKTKHAGLPKKVSEDIVTEGTMAHGIFDRSPKTAKMALMQLQKLLRSPLPAGSAGDQLYNLVFDDDLYDTIDAIASKDGPDTDVTKDHDFIMKMKALVKWARDEIQGPKMRESQVTESAMLDEAGQTLDHILNRFKHEVRNFKDTGELDEHLYEALYDYYLDHGEMPYGVAKARTGDPYSWIADHLDQHLESKDIEEAINDVDVPAIMRKDDPARFPARVMPSAPPATFKPRPEDIPALHRKTAGKDFPVTLDQVRAPEESLDTLRKMAGLPPRP